MFLKKKKGKDAIKKIIKKKFFNLYKDKGVISQDSDFLYQYKNLIKILLNKNKEMTYNEIVTNLKKIISHPNDYIKIEEKLLEIPLIIYNPNESRELTYKEYILILENVIDELLKVIKDDKTNEVYLKLTELFNSNKIKVNNNDIFTNENKLIQYFESILYQESMEFLKKYSNIDYLKKVYLEVGVSSELINKVIKMIKDKYPKDYNAKIKHKINKNELEKHIMITRISLKNYLINIIKSGHSRKEVKKLLIDIGWDKKFVESIN